MADLDSLLTETIAALEKVRAELAEARLARTAEDAAGSTELEQRRRFFVKLFGDPAGIDRLATAARGCTTEDPEDLAKLAGLASEIAGFPLPLSKLQLKALVDFFLGDWYKPIRPTGTATALLAFYAKLFSEPGLASVRQLQRQLADHWTSGTPTEAEIVGVLTAFDPAIAWDSRHVFALLHLLNLDYEMHTLAPYSTGSIW